MKVIIWIVSCITLHFLNAFISAFLGLDFKLSAAAVSVIWILVARWLCRKWDNRVLQKQALASPQDFRKIINALPGHYLKQLEAVRGDRKQVIELVYQIVECGFIPRLYRDQVIDEYSKPITEDIATPTQPDEPPAPAAPESTTEPIVPEETDCVLFCRKCGSKLPADSNFCTKCGTEMVKETTDE